MNYTAIVRKSDTKIQLIFAGDIANNPFDSDSFDTVTIDAEEDNLLDELTALDSSWTERFDIRITPKPLRA